MCVCVARLNVTLTLTLFFQGGAAWRSRILKDMTDDAEIAELEGLLARSVVLVVSVVGLG